MIRKSVVIGLFVLTATVVNAEPVRSAKTADLKIGDGAIRGQLMTTSGHVAGNLQVVLKNHQGRVVGQATADAQGRFAVGPVQPGAYQLQVGNEAIRVRVWTLASAPPTAGTALLFPVGTTVRGNLIHTTANTVGNALGTVTGVTTAGAGLGAGVCVVGATIGTVVAITTTDRKGS